MISLTTPLDVRHGQCKDCGNRASQILLESTIEGKYLRHWLKVDEVRGAGDADEAVCGYHEHKCVEAA